MAETITYPVASLTTYELRDQRAVLDEQLRQMRPDDPGRAVVQQKLHAVVAEQDERARARRRA
jgi:hypothetical protein